MEKNAGILSPEEYWEPTCPLCNKKYGEEEIYRIDMRRCVEKLEEYMSRRDYDGAERHLLFWLAEAEQGRDQRSCFSLHNELMGHYRKVGNGEKAMFHAEKALALLDAVGDKTIAAGTACVNAATVYNAFARFDVSLNLFERARMIYEECLAQNDERLGGLYNNMGLTFTALQRYQEARESYDRAMAVMAQQPHGALEQAITCLNIANTAEEEHGMEQAESEIDRCLEQAAALLDTQDIPRNGYYAFVCEKCAPTFDYYGWFAYAAELNERARGIYERA